MKVDRGMEEPVALQLNRHWRVAVRALRAEYLALAVVIAGVVLVWSGSTPWVLAAGVIGWLIAAAVTLTGFVWAQLDLPEPRPGFWSVRLKLIHDTVRTRNSTQQS